MFDHKKPKIRKTGSMWWVSRQPAGLDEVELDLWREARRFVTERNFGKDQVERMMAPCQLLADLPFVEVSHPGKPETPEAKKFYAGGYTGQGDPALAVRFGFNGTASEDLNQRASPDEWMVDPHDMEQGLIRRPIEHRTTPKPQTYVVVCKDCHRDTVSGIGYVDHCYWCYGDRVKPVDGTRGKI